VSCLFLIFITHEMHQVRFNQYKQTY
jgi:hypothetical protein